MDIAACKEEEEEWRRRERAFIVAKGKEKGRSEEAKEEHGGDLRK